MITESYVWREGLVAAANRLKRLETQKRVFNHSLALCERDLMVGFFSVRKLIEARSKVSSTCAKLPIALQEYPATKPYGNYSRSEFWDCFDLENPTDISRPLEFVANQVIHSYLFSFSFNEKSKPTGVFFVSAKKSGEGCFEIHLNDVINAFQYVARSKPGQLIMTYNKDGGRDLAAKG